MILVTGGAGFIGSHMAKRLRQAGIEHLVVDNLSAGYRSAAGESRFEKLDLEDPGAVDDLFSRHEIEGVIHFAARINVGESMSQPGRYYRTNIATTANLVEAMARHGTSRLVFSSTAAVYGAPEEVPIPETAPARPINVYGETKVAAEQLLRRAADAHGLRVVALRYFNAAGADPEGELGEAHEPETHLIPLTIDAALERRAALSVFGNDYPTPDGTCIRDYIHVWDLCEAHLLALEALERAEGGTFAAYNVGTGSGYSVLEVIRAVEEVTQRSVPWEFGPRREGDPPVLVAQNEAIREDLAWAPLRSDLETMVEDAYRWRKAHPDGYGR
ncbi:MAG: UDP-glucose 4-epimerase GalE [Fimbriimonadales bacterium]|nr:MAG: UDP-glucose 4-epimerase GalE [Fimbriimonadales bacterium]